MKDTNLFLAVLALVCAIVGGVLAAIQKSVAVVLVAIAAAILAYLLLT